MVGKLADLPGEIVTVEYRLALPVLAPVSGRKARGMEGLKQRPGQLLLPGQVSGHEKHRGHLFTLSRRHLAAKRRVTHATNPRVRCVCDTPWYQVNRTLYWLELDSISATVFGSMGASSMAAARKRNSSLMFNCGFKNRVSVVVSVLVHAAAIH